MMSSQTLNDIVDRLIEIVSKTTKISKGDIDIHENLIEMGLDSIIFTQIKNAIQQNFGVDIPFVKIYEELTDLNKIAHYISHSEPQVPNSIDNHKNQEIVANIINNEMFENQTDNNEDRVKDLIKDAMEKVKERSRLSFSEGNNTFAKRVFPLSKEQEGILTQCEISRHNSAFNESVAFGISGNLNLDILQESLDIVVGRHESLRTVVHTEQKTQTILNNISSKITIVEKGTKDTKSIIEKIVAEKFQFDQPLFRVNLIKEADDKWILVLVFHHIIADGWSVGVVYKELSDIYNTISRGNSIRLNPPFQFKEYLDLKSELDKLEKKQSSECHLHSTNVNNFIDLSVELSPINKEYAGSRIEFTEDINILKALRRVSAQNNTSLFNTMVALFMAFLHKVTQNHHLTVGIPFAGQHIVNVENLVGNCVEMIGINLEVEETDNLQSLSNKIKKFFNEIDFIGILNNVNEDQSYNVVFNMNRTIADTGFYETEIEYIPTGIIESKYDLFVSIVEFKNELIIRFDYNSGVLSEETIKRWVAYFREVLKLIIKQDVRPISELNILTESEIDHIMNHFTSFKDDVLKKKLREEDLSKYGITENDDIKVFILNKDMQLQGIGMLGEIYIGPNNIEIYNTNKLGRILENGDLVVLGENTKQIKVKGRNISLFVLEESLITLSKVEEAVCEYDDINSELRAYIVEKEEITQASELLNELKRKLPLFMIPDTYIKVDSLEERQGKEIPKNKETLTTTEDKVMHIWMDILKVENIALEDNFFHLGGNSLTAMKVIGKIQMEFNKSIPIKRMFEQPTVKNISAILDSTTVTDTKENKIVNIGSSEFYQISSVQKRMYALHKIDTNSLNYNVTSALKIEGQLDIEQLESSINKIINRHESLRTYFEEIEGSVVQKVFDELNIQIEYKEYEETIEEKRLIEEEIKGFVRCFDLNKLPLIRVKLVRMEENKYLMLLDTHHIIFDGASLSIFVKELLAVYNGLELPEFKVQYKDYTSWHNQLLTSDKIKKQEAYWKNVFDDEVPVLGIQGDYIRPSNQTFKGNYVSFEFGARVGKKIEQVCKQYEVTPYMFFLASINVLLAKYSGQDDIVIGTAVEGRNHLEFDNLIGMFVNTIPIRNHPESNRTFIEFLSHVKENTLKMFENSDYPFGDLVNLLNIQRDLSRNPLFDVMYTFQNNLIKDFKSKDLEISCHEIKTESSKVDLFFEIHQDEQYQCSIEYNTDIFKKETIERLALHFQTIVENILNRAADKIGDIKVLSDKESWVLLHQFNNIQAEYPRNKTIQELFEEQVDKRPNHIAVVCEDQILTYKELNQKSNQVARMLRQKGVQADTIVGIMVEKSLDMIVGILGILKAGGAYLPINPKLPKDRIEYMIKDSGMHVLLTSNNLGHEEYDLLKVNLSDISTFDGPISNLPLMNTSNDLAYIIYTSGTTGNPKGVMVEHKNVVRLMINDKMPFAFTEKDVWTMFHSYSFDFSVWEMYGALLYGGKLVIVPDLVAKDTTKYLSLLKSEKVTVLNQTPTAFYNLMKAELDCKDKQLDLRYIIFGGEALKPKMLYEWKKKYRQTKLINMYGITETTVHVTFKEIGMKEIISGISNIGQPIPTLKTYIVNEHLHIQPIGITGELCVGGEGVTRGYLNRKELTREKFVDNPFEPGERMYKTGDLARWLSNGEMEYVGRIDNQVKIRGFRIELGEIENRLVSHEQIKEAVVVAKDDEQNQKYLCAYVVCQEQVDKADIKTYLKESLPDYMIPSYFMYLDTIPLTNNGKVNRNALSDPDINGLISSEYEAPQTDIQQKLVNIWRDVLGVERIGIQDNFFDLGGHSLKATVVISEIHKELQTEVPLKELFKSPTIKELSRYIETSGENPYENIEPCEEKEFYETSSAQKRMYTIQQLEKDSIAYNMPVVFELEGEVNLGRIEAIFNRLLQRHEVLRTYYETRDGEIVQKIESDCELKLNYRKGNDITTLTHDFIRAFQLENAPLIRVEIVEIHGIQYLLIDMHHIISDGVSMNILIKEFIKLYNGETLEPLKIQYKDFAHWQNTFLRSDDMKKQEDYWRNQFSDEVPVLHLPYDYERPLHQNFEGDSLHFTIDEETTEKLRRFAKEQEVTMHMFLLSAFYVLLSKYSGQEDIVVGVPIAGRPHADLQNIMGMFVNTLAIRNQPNKEKKFREFLRDAKENTIQAYDNQSYQLEELLEKVNVSREPGRNPLFDVMFDMTNMDISTDIKLNRLTLKPKKLEYRISKFDLTLNAFETSRNIEMSFEYSTKLFKKQTIDRAIRDLKLILDTVVKKDITISNIYIRTEAEQQYLLQEEESLNEIKSIEFTF